MDAARQLTDRSEVTGLAQSYGFSFSTAMSRWPVLALKEGFTFQAGDSERCDRQRLLAALTWIQHLLFRDKVCPLYTLGDHEMGQKLFEESRIAMILTSTLAFKLGELPFQAKITSLPGEAGNSLLIGNGILVNRATNQLPYAKLFLELVMAPEFQEEVLRETDILSVYTDVNAAHRTQQQLEDLGISHASSETALFIQDLITDAAIIDDMTSEMVHFWNGLEEAAQLLPRLAPLLERGRPASSEQDKACRSGK